MIIEMRSHKRRKWLGAAFLPMAFFWMGLDAWGVETDRVYGASSYQFLKLPLAPRTVALGGAGVAAAVTAGELDINPAGPASDSGSLWLGLGYPFAEFQGRNSHVTWGLPFKGGVFLINARYQGFEDIQGYDESAHATTPYGAHTYKLQVGGAGGYRRLQWGLTFNFAENNIAYANYSAVLINVGLRYRLLEGLHAGIAGTNGDIWRSESDVSENESPFPPTAVQAGFSYQLPVWKGFTAQLALDARTRNDEKLTWPVGFEAGWNDILFARVGFPVAEQEPALSAGLGLKFAQFSLDYAVQTHQTLSPGHYLGLGIRY